MQYGRYLFIRSQNALSSSLSCFVSINMFRNTHAGVLSQCSVYKMNFLSVVQRVSDKIRHRMCIYTAGVSRQ